MDKEKVLPLVHAKYGGPSWEHGASKQRDADWERVKPLVEALEEMLGKANVFLSVMEPHTLFKGILLRQLVEGFANAITQAQQALAQLEEK